MAEEGVIVNEDAAINLAHYLTEIGRLRNKTAREIGAAIQSGVNARWGTAKVPQFRDANGIGWVVEITERFDGEVLYAVIRPGEEGRRHVTEVMGEDRLKEMFPNAKKVDQQAQQQSQPKPPRGKKSPPQAATVSNAAVETLTQEVAAMRAKNEEQAQRIEALNAKLHLAQTGDPEGPALLRWKKASKSENGQSFEHEEKQIVVRVIGEEIGKLLEGGVKAEHIEVWSRRQQPKVRFDLE